MLFLISDRMSKNSGKRYRMTFCTVEANISARICPNQRINEVFIAVKYNVFIAVEFSITHLSLLFISISTVSGRNLDFSGRKIK